MKKSTHDVSIDQEVFIYRELDQHFDTVVSELKSELAAVGFGVITEVDMHEKLKEKLNVEVPRYKILGVCNPGFAHKALEIEENIGVFLPCKVVVKELAENKTKVIIGNTELMMSAVGKEELNQIATDVGNTLTSVLDKL